MNAALLALHLAVSVLPPPPPEVATAIRVTLPRLQIEADAFQTMLHEWRPTFGLLSEEERDCLKIRTALGDLNGRRMTWQFTGEPTGQIRADFKAAEDWFNKLNDENCRNKPPGNRISSAINHLGKYHRLAVGNFLVEDAAGNTQILVPPDDGMGGRARVRRPGAQIASPVAGAVFYAILGFYALPEVAGAEAAKLVAAEGGALVLKLAGAQ